MKIKARQVILKKENTEKKDWDIFFARRKFDNFKKNNKTKFVKNKENLNQVYNTIYHKSLWNIEKIVAYMIKSKPPNNEICF